MPSMKIMTGKNGASIFSSSNDKSARVWDASTGENLAILAGQGLALDNARLSPDGSRAITASAGNTARVWDVATGKCLATLAGDEAVVHDAQFGQDGSRIVTTSDDKTPRVWDAATGQSLATLGSHTDRLNSAQFSPDGTRIVTTSDDKTACIWTILPTAAGPPPPWFADFLRYLAQMRLNSDGEMEPLKLGDWLALRERMREVRRASAGQDTPYLHILRRYVPE